MDELHELANLTRELSQEISESIEVVAKTAGLEQHPSLLFSFGTNTLSFCLAIAIECQVRGVPFSKLMEETKGPTKEMTDAALKIMEFCYNEIASKRKPGLVRLRIEPEKPEEGRKP